MSAIEVHHVTKEYRLGSLIGLKDAVLNRVKRLRGLPALERQPFKALDDVDLRVEAGEVVGIIGHNGAGKSTLLKILSGIVTPTRGSVRVVGRIAPLIEVGAGLVGDLTGRENIFLNGAILGMKRAEISKIFDEIVAFSELAEFIDTPVKRYSSGMKVKLAFSVAAHVLADVLIIDEVLAVGDLAFQRKCFSRMEDIIERRGLTVLLVSHNIRQVERLCSRTLLLQQGRIVEDGNTSRVCDIYYSNMNRIVLANAQKTRLAGLRVKSSGETEVLDAQVLDKDGAPVDAVVSGEPLVIRIRFRLLAPLERPEFHIGTHTTDFIYVTGSSSAVLESRPDLGEGVHEISQTIDSFQVKPGTYCIRFAVLDKHRRVVYHGETLHIFGVLPKVSEALQDELRMVDVPVTWTINGQQLASASSHAAGPEAAITGVAAGSR